MLLNIILCREVTECHTIIFSHWPPFSLIKLTTCCCWVRCNAVRNLSQCTQCSSEVRRSNKASFRPYTVLSPLRTWAYCLSVSTSRPTSWSSSPKSGSIMSDSWYLNLLMESDTWNASPAIVTLFYSVILNSWITKSIALHYLTVMSFFLTSKRSSNRLTQPQETV